MQKKPDLESDLFQDIRRIANFCCQAVLAAPNLIQQGTVKGTLKNMSAS